MVETDSCTYRPDSLTKGLSNIKKLHRKSRKHVYRLQETILLNSGKTSPSTTQHTHNRQCGQGIRNHITLTTTSNCATIFLTLLQSSSTIEVTTGVLHRCVLSPLLFTLYSVKCTSGSLSVKLLKFDDTTVINFICDSDMSAKEVEPLKI